MFKDLITILRGFISEPLTDKVMEEIQAETGGTAIIEEKGDPDSVVLAVITKKKEA